MTLPNQRTDPMGAAYAVELTVYQGPLDLLLHLIERQEMDITEVSLLAVTDQYLRAIEQLEEILEQMLEADYAMKTGADLETTIDLLVANLTRRR